LHCLELGKRVETDKGYMRHTNKIKCPNNDCNPAENLGIQGTVRSCQKMLNGRLKTGPSLEKVYCHNITVQGTFFYAFAVITQLAIANSKPLFQVEYGDE
jgi:hypothetical protein